MIRNVILDDWQKEFLKTEGDKILCTGRQVGKSTVCAIDAAEYAVSHPNSQPIVMIAPTERQAYALFAKTLNYLTLKHAHRIKGGKDRPTKSRIKLKSGVEIYCLPVGQSGLGIRFITVGRLYVDEASRMPEDVWTAITPALLTTGGSMIVLSTPFGAQGEFYRIWVNEDKAYDSFKRFSTNSEEVIQNRPISENWTEKQKEQALLKLKQAKKRMTKREYAQEYLGDFVDDLMQFFPDTLIRKCMRTERPEVISKKKRYYLGVDIARMGEDESTFEIGYLRDDGSIIQVENIVTTKTLLSETTKLILRLNSQFDFRKIFLDDGGIGVGVFDHLLTNPDTKRKVIPINNAKRVLDKDDKRKKKLLKVDLYSNLKIMMEQGKIQLLDDENLFQSLKSIQYEYTQDTHGQSKLKIFGNYSHICEGLIRLAWAVKYKSLNIWVSSFKI